MRLKMSCADTAHARGSALVATLLVALLPVGTVVVNPRTDRIRKIVVDSGPQHLRRWRDHQRNLAEDFRRAFHEEPGPLVSVAVMSDSDNTASKAQAWYGDIRFVSRR